MGPARLPRCEETGPALDPPPEEVSHRIDAARQGVSPEERVPKKAPLSAFPRQDRAIGSPSIYTACLPNACLTSAYHSTCSAILVGISRW